MTKYFGYKYLVNWPEIIEVYENPLGHFYCLLHTVCVKIHCNLVIFGHWVCKIPKIYRKLRKRKYRGYCYVVIGTNGCKNSEKFIKTKIARLFLCNNRDFLDILENGFKICNIYIPFQTFKLIFIFTNSVITLCLKMIF